MHRIPWLTLLVATVTVVGLVVEQSVPGTLGHLQRSPAAVHGDWWRWGTALLVQDGHVPGGVFNVAGLLLCGVAAEQVVGRLWWLAFYVGTGLVGQVFGHWWQPVGAGNSVAVCGLAAVCVVAVLRGGGVLHPLTSFAPVVWCGWLAAAVWTPVAALAFVLAMVVSGPARTRSWSGSAVAAFCAACALALLAARDLHGGALTVSLLAAGATVRVRSAPAATP